LFNEEEPGVGRGKYPCPLGTFWGVPKAPFGATPICIKLPWIKWQPSKDCAFVLKQNINHPTINM
jgi:hypothetical protein